ncbi:MAG TPA: thioredoxin family protein [Pirellulales bacterium]|nr:thioredoxin family protein [Pirellulales bacterium]
MKRCTSNHAILLGAVLSLCVCSRAAGSEPTPEQVAWVRSIDEALKPAQESGKDVLINFTGHGWCHYCTLLERAVFAQPEFAAATEHFVLVEIDFPSAASETDEGGKVTSDDTAETSKIKRYRAWQSQYLVPGMPTVVVTDAYGKPVGYAGYEKGITPTSFLNQVEKYRAARLARDRELKEADGKAGKERAAHLDAALECVAQYLGRLEDRKGDPLLNWYPDVVAEIRRLDADDALGLRGKYDRRRQDLESFVEAERVFAKLTDFTLKSEYKEALAYIEQVLPAVSDPKMIWRLVGAREFYFEQDKQHSAAIDHARRLLAGWELTRDQREYLQDRIAYNLKNLGRCAEATSQFDELIEANDDRPAQQLKYLNRKAFYLHHAADAAGDRTEAIIAFQRFRERCELHSEEWQTATWGLSMQFQKSMRFREALALREELVAVEKTPEWLLDLVETQISLGLTEEAAQGLDSADRSIRLIPAVRKEDKDRAERLNTRLRDLRRKLGQ